ncbi:MAG: LuxR C-terminal-related transcriptional regulator [Actinomycetota bacterium]|nr:LuxR C-terminal-related transcriptional regulator [Actinomycetota bacterium]
MPVDSDAVLDLVGEAYAVLDLESFAPRVLDAARHAVPADWASLNALGPDPSVVSIAVPPAPLHIYDAYAKHAHEHPIVRHMERTGDGGPLRISDVVDRRTFHSLTLYAEVCAELGIEHQVAFTLPAPVGHMLAIVLSRRGERDFTDEECELLARARPHLIQAYRNALEHTALLRQIGLAPALPPADLPAYGLTEREAEVIRRVASGRSNRDIAGELGLSARTVQKHLERAYRKLGVSSRSEAARIAWRRDGEGAA